MIKDHEDEVMPFTWVIIYHFRQINFRKLWRWSLSGVPEYDGSRKDNEMSPLCDKPNIVGGVEFTHRFENKNARQWVSLLW